MRQTAKSAYLPGSSEPDVAAAEHVGAAPRPEAKRVPRRQRARAALPARDEERPLRLAQQVGAFVRGRAVDAEPHAHPFVEHRAHGRDACAQAEVRARAVGDPGARLGEAARTSPGERWTRAHQTSSSSQPTRGTRSGGTRRSPAVLLLLDRLGQVRVQADRLAGELGRPVMSCFETENGEQGATAICVQALRPVLVKDGQALRVGQHVVGILDEIGLREAAVGLPDVHRAARGDQADADVLRRLDLGLDEPRAARGEDVVVVEHGRGTGERQLRQARSGRRVLRLGVDPRPDGIERCQPLEEVALLRPGAGQVLVQVVVRVQRGRRRACRRGSRRSQAAAVLADVDKQPVLGQEPAVLELGSLVVHRDNQGVREERAHRASFSERLERRRDVLQTGEVVWPLANRSTWGSAARMPRASGS